MTVREGCSGTSEFRDTEWVHHHTTELPSLPGSHLCNNSWEMRDEAFLNFPNWAERKARCCQEKWKKKKMDMTKKLTGLSQKNFLGKWMTKIKVRVVPRIAEVPGSTSPAILALGQTLFQQSPKLLHLSRDSDAISPCQVSDLPAITKLRRLTRARVSLAPACGLLGLALQPLGNEPAQGRSLCCTCSLCNSSKQTYKSS